MTTLRVESLKVKLANKFVVEDFSVELSVGDWVCVIGPNGAGKSSMLRALAGIIDSDGEMFIYVASPNEPELVGLPMLPKNLSCHKVCQLLTM